MIFFVYVLKNNRDEYRYIIPATPTEDRDVNGPLLSNYHLWQRKIKKAFDPNVASDPGLYIEIKS